MRNSRAYGIIPSMDTPIENKKTTFLSPQQELMLSNYTNPKSLTFGNAYMSAIGAGYSDSYAKAIMHQLPSWLSENLADLARLRKAEKVLDKTLEYETDRVESDKTIVDTGLLRIQNETARFVAETMGKNKYSKKSDLEQLASGGLQVVINIVKPEVSSPKIDDTSITEAQFRTS